MSPRSHLVTLFLRWIWLRALLHNGWWLVTSVYLVIDAHLSPSQLVLVGVAQGVVALIFEIPAGALADTLSRKWSLVFSHALMGAAMVATGLVTGFVPLVATQMLWGLSWNFASGADVAWITDELDEPTYISGVLVRSGRAQLTGAAAGILGVGALASLTHRSAAMVAAGLAMMLLGLYVALRFPERRFVRVSTSAWLASWAILAQGSALVRRSRVILLMLAATALVSGAGDAARLFPRRLIDIGLPADPVPWVTVLGVLTVLVGAGALRAVQPHIDGPHTARRGYVVACGFGALGLVGLAVAPNGVAGSIAILLVAGVAIPLTRTIGSIWVNRETSSEVRATVHSFLAQAEYVGEIVFGLAIAGAARFGGTVAALAASGGLCAVTLVLVQVLGGDERPKSATTLMSRQTRV